VIIRPRAWCAILALTLVPVVAGAQTARNPFADLFGRAPSEVATERTRVQLRTTAGAQIGQTLRADFESQEVVPEGLAAGADATLSAEYLRSRFKFSGQSRYSYQEYRSEPAFGAPGFDTGGRIQYDVTTRLSVQGGAQYVRSPYYQLLWLPAQIYGTSLPTAADGTAILLMRNDSVQASGGFDAQLGKRTSLSAQAFTRQTRFDDAAEHQFTSVGGRSQLRRQLTRTLGLHAGYSREELRSAPSESSNGIYVNELIDVGVDFAKSFSMGRRTTFAFGTETAFLSENDGGRQFRLNGSAVLERLFLRTWIARLGARRSTEFVPGFRAPLLTDRGNAMIAGHLTKRVMLEAAADGGRGEIGVSDARSLTTYNGYAALTFAVTRHLGVFTQYAYYNYQMPRDPLALVTVQHLSRHAVSIGVKTWISLIDKEQVPRDPR
jgi:hypothetical protein